ncbi:MerR family transcriptional regulator [Alicyclobacillus curvatus]|jgi:MerR family transcriptional regulator, glutamine synthetase repressor|nr:MerR family transcriptional regulator [Alicyclobacillus curvatus]
MDLESRKQLPLFSIGIVEKLTGLSARQIRYYEQHELVKPARSAGNQRLFSFVDVERLIQVSALLDEGLNMEGVKARIQRLMASQSQDKDKKQSEPTDHQVYERMRQEMLEHPGGPGSSEFQGDLFRFYRKR